MTLETELAELSAKFDSLNHAQFRWVVTGLACKAIAVQQLAGFPVSIETSEQLASSWLSPTAQQSAHIVAAVGIEVGNMMQEARSLLPNPVGNA